jgi:O-antigen/teichoic acid export membrane protein
MVFYLVLLPFWSAYTEAFTRGDIPWIQRTLDVLRRLWFLSVAIVILMTFFANTFYRMWVGREIHIPIAISIAMGIYVLIIAWSSIYSNFINGTGIIRMELLYSIAAGIVNIPLAIIFSKYLHLGIPGVILAPSLCLFPGCFLWPLQVKKILSGKAAGIWGKK